jgi:hypothetical protein
MKTLKTLALIGLLAILAIAGSILDAAKNPNNPDHAIAKQMVSDFLGLDPAISYDLIPAVRNQIAMQRLQTKLDEINGRLAAAGNNEELKRQIIAEMQAESSDLITVIQNAISDTKSANANVRGRVSPELQANIDLAASYKAKLEPAA